MAHGGVRRPQSFDGVAALYDRARPRYPAALVDDLVGATGIGPGSRVLEIGCGTGQLTVPLARRGVDLTAVEMGGNLAAVARRNLAPFPTAQVVVSAFEDWPLPDEPFDLVVSATAFHWFDPAVRVEKSAAALRPGGVLAIVETHWGMGQEPDDFWLASQVCFERWDPHHDPDFRPPRIKEVATTKPELEQSRHFTGTELRRYPADRDHTAGSYCSLLGTWSNILGLEESARAGLLGCLHDLIERRFGGTIVRHDLIDLWLAHRL